MSDVAGLLVPDRMIHAGGLIGIPAGEQGRWTEFTIALSVLERPKGSRLAVSQGAYVQANRNFLVEDCLASDAQWLFMVDDDHVFDRKLLIDLLDRRVDVVGALALARKPPYFVCAFEESNSRTGISRGVSIFDVRPGLMPVAAVGTGAILIRRHVLEAIEPPWFAHGFDENGVNVSEDIVFCEKVREAGFGVFLDGAKPIGHLTGVALWLVPEGIKFDLGNEQNIVIPKEQIEEEVAEPVAAGDHQQVAEEIAEHRGATLEEAMAAVAVTYPPVADEVPIVTGAAGLRGRPQIVRPGDLEEPPVGEDGEPLPVTATSESPSLPGSCLRVLHSPLAADHGGGCQHDCPGRQRDGGCLAELVREANAAGREWAFDVDPEGYWVPK